MRHQEAWERLSDFLDDALPAAEQEALRAHLDACAICRAELAALRKLVRRAGELPASVEPARDLWPGIAEAISQGGDRGDSEPATAQRGTERVLSLDRWRRRYLPALVAAAAIVVLALLARQMAGPQRPGGPTQTAEAPAESAAAGGRTPRTAQPEDPTVVATIAGLDAECYEGDLQLAALSEAPVPEGKEPSGLGKILEALRQVDRAISEARAAWEADPKSPHLARMVTTAYRAKIALQRQAVELPAAPGGGVL